MATIDATVHNRHDDESSDRPTNCMCDGYTDNLACWPCVEAGYETAAVDGQEATSQ